MDRGTAISIRLDDYADRAWRLAARTSGVSLRDWCDGAARFALSEEGATVVKDVQALVAKVHQEGEMNRGVTVEVTSSLLELISAQLHGSTVRQWLRYHLTAVALYELADREISVDALPPEVDDDASFMRPTRKRREPKDVVTAARKGRRKRQQLQDDASDAAQADNSTAVQEAEQQLQEQPPQDVMASLGQFQPDVSLPERLTPQVAEIVTEGFQAAQRQMISSLLTVELPTGTTEHTRKVLGMSNKELMDSLFRQIIYASHADLLSDTYLMAVVSESHKRLMENPEGFSLRHTTLIQNALRGIETAQRRVPTVGTTAEAEAPTPA